jgi:hypothetical protein
MPTTTFAARLTTAVARVPDDMRARVTARVRARPHELADLERVVERRYGVAAAAARPAKRRPRPRGLAAELDAAVADGRILASRRAHYERLAAAKGTAAVLRILRSLSPGLDPATSAALATSADLQVAADEGPWFQPRSRAPGWNGAGPRPSRRIDWSLDGADVGDDPVVQASSGPDLAQRPFTAPPPPNLAPLGSPRANGRATLPGGRTRPGLIIDGNGPA